MLSPRPPCSWCVLLGLVVLGWAEPVLGQKQEDRNRRTTPGLTIETGARRGSCDALTFTADGKDLLAAGDDKVVHVWKVTEAGVAGEDARVLRWPIFREQRGGIHALALSPDGRRVVVGGFGVVTDLLAVLDLATGKIENAMTDTPDPRSQVVWALAFSPSGKEVAVGKDDGSVWLWDLAGGKKSDVRRLGAHPQEDGPLNRVRLTVFTGEAELLSVARDGSVLQWDLSRPGTPPHLRFRFEKNSALFRVAVSPDRKWLAAVGENAGQKGKPVNPRHVEVRSLDGRQAKGIDLREPGHFPQCLAFDAHGTRLAVGARIVGQPPEANFFKEIGGRVFVYDLRGEQPREEEGPRPTYRPDAVAFQPQGHFLAVAGGDNHEVLLWDLRTRKPAHGVEGPGRCLWSVALSENADGHYLGFREQRKANPLHPNDWGAGDWKVFDLHERKWVPRTKRFFPHPPLQSDAGWKVRPDPTRADRWFVDGPEGQSYPLPIDTSVHGLPRCYTFLETEDKGARLAVGHFWGVSIFDLTPRGPRLRRLLVGHEGEVMAVAQSPDGKSLVSASRDQTVNVWSLADWENQGELGASFVVQNGKVLVRGVDPGSPGWEAGLTPGDEVTLLAVGGNQFLYDAANQISAAERQRRKIQKVGAADACLEQLGQPVPGVRFDFWLRRGDQKDFIQTLTTVRQRPVLRFLPTHDGEWVLWRWRDYYYDTSTQGDGYIGWHVNPGQLDGTPSFFRAEQLRKRFHQPGKVAATVRNLQTAPEQVLLADVEPPTVQLTLDQAAVKDGNVTATLTAVPRHGGKEQELQRVALWINDYLLQSWEAGAAPPANLVLPKEKLRLGENVVTLQAFNEAGGRGEAQAVVEFSSDKTPPRQLHVVAVGVNDYEKVRRLNHIKNKKKADDLVGAADATEIADLWKRQAQTRLFARANIVTLLDQEVTRERVLRRLREVARQAQQPNDMVVLFMAGHGLASEREPGSFEFICHDCDLKRPDTRLTSRDLYEVLAEMPCHKLVLLDSCHSGDVAASAVDTARALRQDGIGSFILAACAAHELAYESARGAHGDFTSAILKAGGTDFALADTNNDGRLDIEELFRFVEKEVRESSEDAQHPTCSPLLRRLPRVYVLGGKDRKTALPAYPPAPAARPVRPGRAAAANALPNFFQVSLAGSAAGKR